MISEGLITLTRGWHSQRLRSFFFVELWHPAEFVIAHSSFQESSAKVADARLTQFELELDNLVRSGGDKQGGTLVVCIGLHRLFFFKK
jgi:hypothetical protein